MGLNISCVHKKNYTLSNLTIYLLSLSSSFLADFQSIEDRKLPQISLPWVLLMGFLTSLKLCIPVCNKSASPRWSFRTCEVNKTCVPESALLSYFDQLTFLAPVRVGNSYKIYYVTFYYKKDWNIRSQETKKTYLIIIRTNFS